jgi:hypothetical protein
MFALLRNLSLTVVLAALVLSACSAAAQKKGAAASPATAAPSPSSSSSAPIEVQMLSYGALDQVLDKIASAVCDRRPAKVIVLDAPTLLALQDYDSFFVTAEALKGAFDEMTSGSSAGGGVDDFADISTAVATAAAASTSETSSSFTISDPTAALMLLNHLGTQNKQNKTCTNSYYGGIYSADESQGVYAGTTLDKDGNQVPQPLFPVLKELNELSLVRNSALNTLKPPAGKGSASIKIDAPGDEENLTSPASVADATAPRSGLLQRVSFALQNPQAPKPPAPTGPPQTGRHTKPANPNPDLKSNSPQPHPPAVPDAGGHAPQPTVVCCAAVPAPAAQDKAAGTADPRVAAFNSLDASYNSFLSGLSAPNATTGQPLLSSILQGFRVRALMSCTLDQKDTNKKKLDCPTDEKPVIGIYVNVASAGGTQQDRKNLITAVITGDWIRYSGGVSVNVIVFQVGGTKNGILFSDLIRYRTPLKTIKKPAGYNDAGSYGDNLGDVVIP